MRSMAETGSPLMNMQTVHHVGKRVSGVQLSNGCCGERFITGEALLTWGHPLISPFVIFSSHAEKRGAAEQSMEEAGRAGQAGRRIPIAFLSFCSSSPCNVMQSLGGSGALRSSCFHRSALCDAFNVQKTRYGLITKQNIYFSLTYLISRVLHLRLNGSMILSVFTLSLLATGRPANLQCISYQSSVL